MSKPPASRPTSNRLRFSGAFFLLLAAALACNLPFAGAPSSQPEFAPDSTSGPSVIIQQPAPNLRVSVGESFNILATASDPSGVVRLDLFVDSMAVLSQSAPDANGLETLSLMYPLVGTQSGTYALIVRAYNSKGETRDSLIHYVTVNDAPSSSPAAPEFAQYVVQEGDTLENIAQRLGISVDDLQKANPAIQNGQVAPGQVILIPLNAKPVVQAAVPAPGGGAQPVGQPVNRPGGGQPAGGQQGPPQQRPAPNPANPAPVLAVKSTDVTPNPVYYGANCQANHPTLITVTAKVEPVASIGKVILAYAFIDSAGGRSQDNEIVMQSSGADYKTDVNVGGLAEAHLAQTGGKLDLRVEAYDKDGKLSTSPIYTVNVTFCPAPQAAPGGVPPAGPGVNPIFPGGPVQLPSLPPGALPAPVLFPPVILNPSNGISFAPHDVVSALNGCEVSLAWNDSASSETNYRIWRIDPGAPASKLIGSVKPDVTQYKDTLTRAGKYAYEIEYYRLEQPDPNTTKEITERSWPLWVEVPPSVGCPDTNARRVMFEPVFFAPADMGLKYGFLNVTINNFSALRVPRGQQTNFSAGMIWDASDERRAIPIATLNAGGSLVVEIQGNGLASSDSQLIVLLGSVSASHSYESLTAPDAKDKIWEATNGQMTVRYKLWMEGWQWGGAMASNELPIPRDLLLFDSTKSRSLSWEVDAKNPPNHDGFIVYSTYSCPGLAQPIFAHRVVSKTRVEFKPSDEPAGCSCTHQVSSFGAAGESQLSVPTAGCQTTPPEESVIVMFDRLKINSVSQPFSAAMTIFANGSSQQSGSLWFPNKAIYLFEPYLFANSKITINFVPGQSRAIQVGFSVDGFCSGQAAYGGQNSSWPAEPRLFQMVSTDGNCEVNVSFQRKTP